MSEAAKLEQLESLEQHITASDVVDYLRQNPDFFSHRSDLLFDMALPHGQGNAISLLEYQARVLRNRNTELRHKLNDLISIAKENDQLFQKVKKLGLNLLEVSNISDAAITLQETLKNDFQLDHSTLFLFKPRLKAAPAITITANKLRSKLGDLLRAQRIICTILRKKELTFLFPEYKGSEGSAALIPLHFHGDLGLLAIGSNQSDHFNSDMDTSFARYIGDILSRRLYHFLT